MKAAQNRLVEGLSVIGYFLMTCFFMNIFSIGEYDWMLEPGGTVCELPLEDNMKDITGPVLMVIFGMPLVIVLIRDFFLRDYFKAVAYSLGLMAVICYGWWVFWGRYNACV